MQRPSRKSLTTKAASEHLYMMSGGGALLSGEGVISSFTQYMMQEAVASSGYQNHHSASRPKGGHIMDTLSG